MKKNILNLYEGFFDDLDKLNPNQNKEDKVNDGFGDVNGQVYDEHDFILSPDKNPEFFYGLYNMCRKYFPNLPSNENGFTQKDLNKITFLDDNEDYFYNIISLDELQYFNNLKIIKSLCFFNCRKLKSVIFPKNLKRIEYGAFESTSSLKEVIFPENIQFIDIHAFMYCISLKKIVIPERFRSYNRMENIFNDIDLTKVDITYI